MSDIQTLVDMGFEKARVEYAMKVTGYKGIEPAMEWLLAHADETIPTTNEDGPKLGTTADGATASDVATTVAAAKSLKCEDCGKICKNADEMQLHASKSSHTNFSESTEEKPELTPEERKAQLALIEEKLKLKRQEREERERVDALEREKNRIKSGKDLTEARKRMEELEMKKLVEQRKKEKADEKAARDRVKAQIEADKAARKAREQKEDEAVVSSAVSITPASFTNAVAKTPTKDYTQTRIQIRLNDGDTLTETFNVKEQLSAVRVFIQMKTGADIPFRLMTTFPRKIFSDEEYEKPLDALGLVPSAVLTMTKIAQ